MLDEEHHLEASPFKDAGIGMVSCFPHDYMHLVCLGVMQKLLDLSLASGPLCCRLSARQSVLISDALISLRRYIPVDFARKPRQISEILVTVSVIHRSSGSSQCAVRTSVQQFYDVICGYFHSLQSNSVYKS